VAKYLEVANRTDIPVAIGTKVTDSTIRQGEWVGDFELDSYPGTVYADGVTAMIDMIMGSEEIINLIVIGPVPNIQEVLEREPGIQDKVRVYAMSGSVDLGYGADPEPDPETNVVVDAEAARAMYMADWDLTIAPLDTAGTIQLTGPRYQRVLQSEKPLIRALIENYRIWAQNGETGSDPDIESSILFDTLAVAFLLRPDFVEIKEIQLEVTDDGFTRRSPEGKMIKAAMSWKDKDGFEEWLVTRLIH
jgi:inosine-uridine nucleoside N-ribohydrolase